MALKLDLVGKTMPQLRFRYGWRNTVLYALSVGARVDEIDYLYEGRGPKVLPTFAGLACFEALVAIAREMGAHPLMMSQGEQRLTFHRPLPPQGEILTSWEVKGVYDQDKAAVVVAESRSIDEHGGRLFDGRFSLVVRGEGGFGGERPPPGPRAEPPAGQVPDFEITERTTAEQALLYRLCGDVNPVHADPAAAKLAGLDQPTLSELCVLGFLSRAVIKAACGGDSGLLRGVGGRFTGTATPGDVLITRGWQSGGGRYVVRVVAGDGHEVFGGGSAEIGSATG